MMTYMNIRRQDALTNSRQLVGVAQRGVSFSVVVGGCITDLDLCKARINEHRLFCNGQTMEKNSTADEGIRSSERVERRVLQEAGYPNVQQTRQSGCSVAAVLALRENMLAVTTFFPFPSRVHNIRRHKDETDRLTD